MHDLLKNSKGNNINDLYSMYIYKHLAARKTNMTMTEYFMQLNWKKAVGWIELLFLQIYPMKMSIMCKSLKCTVMIILSLC